MTALDTLLTAMAAGTSYDGMGNNTGIRELLDAVYDERYARHAHHKKKYQYRANMKDASAASYAGYITADNPTSGAYQGTSFVWFPGDGGSVAVVGIGTDGFGQDTHILGRPGHRRRLKALSRLLGGRLWVKPDLLDIDTPVPPTVASDWPAIGPQLKAYDRVIYAAVAVRDTDASTREAVEDLLDLFFHEHGTPTTGKAKKRWENRQTQIAAELFPRVPEDEIVELLRQRRFVILEGPPGTGKTRIAFQHVAPAIGSSSKIQFHPARTYEDFVVGLHPDPSGDGLRFQVRPGDLLRANDQAHDKPHVLIIDEINRADLARVLGEAIVLFEVGDDERTIKLPHVPEGFSEAFGLSPNLLVLGTRNTSDRTIARLDLAIRRRFAFVEVWPRLDVVQAQGVDPATEIFEDVLMTFAEHADDEVLRLVPGHSYVLDPRPDLDEAGRPARIKQRIRLELLPLLRDYLDERLAGAASRTIAGLIDRIDSKLLAWP